MAARHSPTAPADGLRRSPSRTPAPTRTSITTTARRDGDGLGAQRTQGLHLRRRRGRRHVLVVGRTEDARTGKLEARACSSSPTTRPASSARPIDDGTHRRRRSSSRCSSTTSAARRSAGRRRGRGLAAAVRRAATRSAIMTARRSRSAWPGTRSKAVGVRHAAAGLAGPDRLPPGHRAPAGARSTSSSNWPG